MAHYPVLRKFVYVFHSGWKEHGEADREILLQDAQRFQGSQVVAPVDIMPLSKRR
jgi:hypothetical protein